jgi:hypothetical protein
MMEGRSALCSLVCWNFCVTVSRNFLSLLELRKQILLVLLSLPIEGSYDLLRSPQRPYVVGKSITPKILRPPVEAPIGMGCKKRAHRPFSILSVRTPYLSPKCEDRLANHGDVHMDELLYHPVHREPTRRRSWALVCADDYQ